MTGATGAALSMKMEILYTGVKNAENTLINSMVFSCRISARNVKTLPQSMTSRPAISALCAKNHVHVAIAEIFSPIVKFHIDRKLII